MKDACELLQQKEAELTRVHIVAPLLSEDRSSDDPALNPTTRLQVF